VTQTDLLGPPGRCSGCWPHDGEVAGGAVAISFSGLLFADSGSGRPMMMSASPGRGGGDGDGAGRAQRGTGSSTTDRKICSTDRGSDVERLLALLGAEDDSRLPALAAEMLGILAEHLREIAARVREVEIKLLAWHGANPASRRLESIPGIGPITASAIVATVGDPRQFQSGRQFAAWLGLVPQQRSSGGKERLGGISKRGDGYIRRLLVHGARAIVGWRKRSAVHTTPWIARLLERRPMNVATVAYANKLARIAWAIMIREDRYNPVRAFAAVA